MKPHERGGAEAERSAHGAGTLHLTQRGSCRLGPGCGARDGDGDAVGLSGGWRQIGKWDDDGDAAHTEEAQRLGLTEDSRETFSLQTERGADRRDCWRCSARALDCSTGSLQRMTSV
ncbi:hypothetical protein EYF80_052001 [Liparis tanakae]|uniref:Uncharacterized protein n=1 Tax=Liparis tanakae TaxID=230148 RepID=A0A4Z2FA99_9TELE|nr:hypothetical protein EYF80_052001 [Liparis tanakae]